MPMVHLEFDLRSSSNRVMHWPANCLLARHCRGGNSICFRLLMCLLAIGQVSIRNVHHCSCSMCTMQERVSLRDCQVGPGFIVSEGAEHREEVLAKAQQQRRSTDAKP